MSFAQYFIARSLGEQETTITESLDAGEFRKATRRAEKELKGAYIKRLYERFPRIQYKDVEDAFDAAVKEVKRGKPRSEAATKRAILKAMEKSLSGVNKRKREVGKSLSCVQAVKSSLATGQSMSDLMARAEKMLTSQEIKVMGMCAEGKPVRKIAEEMGTSFPTAWRILNSALDKIRISHGMRPRHKDRRG